MIEIINIYNLLKDNNSEKHFISHNAQIKTVSLFPLDKRHLNPSILYIGKLSAVINENLDLLLNIVCINDLNLKSVSTRKNLNLILINQTIEKEDLLLLINNYINAYYDYIEKKLKLNDAMLSDNGLTGIMNQAYTVFNNPLVFVNLNYRLVSYPQNMDVSKDPDWIECINAGAAPYSFIKKIIATDPDNFDKLLYTEDPNLLESSGTLLTNRSLGLRVSLHSKAIGFVCLLEHEKIFDDFDVLLLRTLSDIVSNEIQKEKFYHQNKGLFYEHFYYDLLNENFSNDSAVRDRAKNLFLNSNEGFFIFSIRSSVSGNTRLYPFFRDHLEKIILDCHSIMYEEQIVIIIRKTTRTIFSEKLETYLQENNLIGGISYSFEDIIKIKVYYHQSITAIELGNRLDPEKNLFFYEDYMPYHIFDLAKKNTDDLELFLHPFIKELSDYDQKHKTNYSDSLRVFLEYGNNLIKASKILNIHRNTLDYHIHKINDILSTDVNNPKTSRLLLISFMILEYSNS